jgi:hypothetical protein
MGLLIDTAICNRFVCWGPTKPPMEMTANENARWNAHLHSPVIFNHHTPVEVNESSIRHVDLNPITSTRNALANKERVLILTPLRNAAHHIPQHFDLISQLTYPHDLIDLAFLVGDSTDDTLAILAAELERVQSRSDSIKFRSATIVEKDFGVTLNQDVEERHKLAAQGPRRVALGKARNYLLSSALRPEHAWVYWRDIDIQDSPSKILEDFMLHDRDVLVPNVWFHRYRNDKDIEGRCTLTRVSSWTLANELQSTTTPGRRLKRARRLSPVLIAILFWPRVYFTPITQYSCHVADPLLGYKEIKTYRKYMATEGDWRNNKDEEMPLDGIGGVNILVKADVHRSGQFSTPEVLFGPNL